MLGWDILTNREEKIKELAIRCTSIVPEETKTNDTTNLRGLT
jgi:hypothetical protein